MIFNTAVKLFAFPEITFSFHIATFGAYFIFLVFSFCVLKKLLLSFCSQYLNSCTIRLWKVILAKTGETSTSNILQQE